MGTTKTKTSGSFGTMFSKRWLLFFTIAVAIIFGVISPAFLQVTNLLNILSSACIVGVMGVGLTCIFATGELDFSAGSQVSLASCIMAVVLGRTSLHNYVAAFILTIAVLTLIGLYNAFLHVKVGIPAFIATLGTSYLVKGIAKALTNSKNVNNLASWPKAFTFFGTGLSVWNYSDACSSSGCSWSCSAFLYGIYKSRKISVCSWIKSESM